jgi:hypothetical protein
MQPPNDDEYEFGFFRGLLWAMPPTIILWVAIIYAWSKL